jgi:hypothetical protein
LQSRQAGYWREFRCGETVLVPASASGLEWDSAGAVLLGAQATGG